MIKKNKFIDIDRDKRLNALFQAATNVSFIVTDAGDPEPTILEFSPGAENIFGYTREEMVGRSVSVLHLPEDVREIPEAHQRMRQGKKGFDGKMTLVRKNGEHFPALFSSYPLFDKDGRMSAGLGVSLDISRQESLQSMLHQSQKLEAIGRLAGGVAHDFNNMLSVILGHTELAMEQLPEDNPVYEDLREIGSAARRSADLTRQLLGFARRQTISPELMNLNESVGSMLKMLRRLIGEDIDLLWQPGPDPMTVFIDPSQLDQILANLCVNARDAINGVGKITIETAYAAFDEDYCADHPESVPGDFVCLAVSDDGCGMEKEMLKNLFEPFFTTKDIGKGTGLGLATVFGIVKQNKGFIIVYSEPGKGATFRIYLPFHMLEAPTEEVRAITEIPVGRGEAILVVEDEVSILRLAKRILEKLGYQVMSATSPEEALAFAADYSGRIDLLITDVVMPEMNGRELSERLQEHFQTLQILFMSGYTADAIAHRGVLEEGVNFVQKPFSYHDLAVKVRQALEK